MSDQLNCAWAAGLFDGEGSTSVLKAKRDRYSYVRMCITQKEREVLDKFLSIVKVGKIYGSRTRNIYSLNIYKQTDVESVLTMLWPFLSKVKQCQAIEAFHKAGKSFLSKTLEETK